MSQSAHPAGLHLPERGSISWSPYCKGFMGVDGKEDYEDYEDYEIENPHMRIESVNGR
jgi:hypothetical protein